MREGARWRKGELASAGMAGIVGMQTVECCSVPRWESSMASLMRWRVLTRLGFGTLGFRHLNYTGVFLHFSWKTETHRLHETP